MRRTAVVLTVLAAVLSGCSFSFSVGGPSDVKRAELESGLKDLVAGVDETLTPSEVSCPKPLKAEVDATAPCTFVANDLEYRTEVTVTKVEDGEAKFEISQPDGPFVPPAVVGDQVVQLIGPQIDLEITDVACPDALLGEVDETIDCEMTLSDGSTGTARVTVTKADFYGVDFHIETV